MKVPVRKLEALEADRLHELPDAVFIRALAASVCRTLKVDAAPILAKLPQSVVPKLDRNESGVSMPGSGASLFAGRSLAAFAFKPSVLMVLALLLAALAVVFVPEARNTVGISPDSKVQPADSAQATAQNAVPMAAVNMGTEKAAVATPAQEAPAPVVVVAPMAAPAAAPAVATASTPASTPQHAVASVVASSAAAPAAAGVLVFKVRERAWIRVSDSKGSVQFEKTLAAGETAAASGAMPLSVVVGNAAATEVVVRGQPFGLEEVTQNNVARFEVK
jgi:cytoskeleton protein RodZ